MPLTYNRLPIVDTLNITFASGNIEDDNNYVGLGSRLYLDKLQVSYRETVSVDENNAVNSINVFPNPNNGNCNVNVDIDKTQPVTIELFNENGQKVYAKTMDNAGK